MFHLETSYTMVNVTRGSHTVETAKVVSSTNIYYTEKIIQMDWGMLEANRRR